MFGSLGFVDGATSRPLARNPNFMGSSGHPSKKDLRGPVRRQTLDIPVVEPKEAPAQPPPPPMAAKPPPGSSPAPPPPLASAKPPPVSSPGQPQGKGEAAQTPGPRAAPPPQAAAPPQPPGTSQFAGLSERAVAERRWLYLEGADKARAAELADIRRDISGMKTSAAEAAPIPVMLRARVAADAPIADGLSAAPGEPTGVVKGGASVQVAYPMLSSGGAVWMRHMQVHPRTAALSWNWIKVFEELDGADVVYLSDFE